jgi:hypothetical protein
MYHQNRKLWVKNKNNGGEYLWKLGEVEIKGGNLRI